MLIEINARTLDFDENEVAPLIPQAVVDLTPIAVSELGVDFVEVLCIPSECAECWVHGTLARGCLASLAERNVVREPRGQCC